MDTSTGTIRWEQDAAGVVVLTMDDPSQSANTMNAAWTRSVAAVLDRLESERATITGVVVTSAKKTFFAGGDLNDLIRATAEQAPELTAHLNRVKSYLRRLETLGVPVVAAINGAALGGGLEIALACHYRVAANVKGSVIGLPEVTLGLLPGAGGITRTVRMLGVRDAIAKVLILGQRHRPHAARDIGLIDQVLDTVAELVPAAKAWISAHPDAVQPWDVKGYRIPGGTPTSPGFAAHLPALPANLRKQLKGAPIPAPRAVLAAAVEGAQVDFDTASVIETRYLVSLVVGQVSKNMIKAFFFDLQHVNGGGSRPAGYPQHTVRRLGVIGAGMMGAAIAYVCAQAGIEVVLKDVTLAAAVKGKGYAETREATARSRGKTTEQRSAELLARITPTSMAADFAGVDFVIEAVVESVDDKHAVFAEIQDVVEPDAILGSNTSTLPITTLARGVARSADFIGVHFFSPVDKMTLVELIRGEQTSDATLAKVIDFTRQIGKTPIVVNDSRGFFTSRVIGTFLNEAVAALGEGVDPATIEQAASQAGYPTPPLQLMDELTLTLPRKIREETKLAVLAAGGTWSEHGSHAVIDAMLDTHGRHGRSSGTGFYGYDEHGMRTGLWSGLRAAFGTGTGVGSDVPFIDLQERMLFAEALEAVRCLDEGVLTSVPEANIGSILGIGFPAWTGGVIQYINGYDGGLQGFADRAFALAQRYGPQFTPPPSLVAKAGAGQLIE